MRRDGFFGGWKSSTNLLVHISSKAPCHQLESQEQLVPQLVPLTESTQPIGVPMVIDILKRVICLFASSPAAIHNRRPGPERPSSSPISYSRLLRLWSTPAYNHHRVAPPARAAFSPLNASHGPLKWCVASGAHSWHQRPSFVCFLDDNFKGRTSRSCRLTAAIGTGLA